ncbi:MAG: hypothetical protein RL757_1985 [Bacteroidota bacterium]|jgi:hypothetical protein
MIRFVNLLLNSLIIVNNFLQNIYKNKLLFIDEGNFLRKKNVFFLKIPNMCLIKMYKTL